MVNFYLDLRDKRLQEVAKLLNDRGYNVFDFEKNIDNISNNDVCVVSPAYKWEKEVLLKIKSGTTVFGSKLQEELKDFSKKLNYICLMDIEDFVVENARLTAEGFLADLIINTDKSLYEQKILVLGNGRVAKAVWYLFYKLGISFDASMRRESEFNLSKLIANKSYLGETYKDHLLQYDIVINTIPARLFTLEDEKYFKKGSVLFELASKKCLEENFEKVKYVLCPALPSKYTPKSAGKLIYNEVIKYLEGER